MRERERVLTLEQKRQVLDGYAEGKKVAVIAESLQIPNRTPKQKRDIVYMMLRRHRLPIAGTPNEGRIGPPVRLDHAEILRLYATGLGAPAIAKQLGCGTTAVHKITTRAGVTRKQKGWSSQHGYIKVKVNGKYMPQHRHIMEQHLGRPLDPNETVHHINGDGMDNRLENLQLRRGKHGKGLVQQCQDCGSFNVKAVPIAERDGHA